MTDDVQIDDNKNTSRGRPPIKFSVRERELIEHCILAGHTQESICEVLGISTKTFRTHFSEEISKSKMKLEAELTGIIIDKCRSGDFSALKYYMQTHFPERWNLQTISENIIESKFNGGDIQKEEIEKMKSILDNLNIYDNNEDYTILDKK